MSETLQTANTIILNINLEGPNQHRLQARLDGEQLIFEVIDRDKKPRNVSSSEAMLLLEMRRSVMK